MRSELAYNGCMDISTLKVILIHGNGGITAQDNWYPYVQKELERFGLKVIARDFPDAQLARKEYWLPFLKNECGADENSILIGHSSGAIAAMRFAEENRIFGSVLVAAYYTDTGYETERQSGYFDAPWNWEAIKNNQNWIIQFASQNDPYFSVEEPRLVHEKLGTEYYEYKNRGHFFDLQLPELVETVKRKLA